MWSHALYSFNLIKNFLFVLNLLNKLYHKLCVEQLLERQIRDNNHPFCLICFQWEMQDKKNGGN